MSKRWDGKWDQFNFTGDEEMNGTLDNTAVATAIKGTDIIAVDIAITDHGYKAGSNIFIKGTTNYDGMRPILSLPDANSMVVRTPDVRDGNDVGVGYVAETPAGTEVYFPGITYPDQWEFLGFKLHLSSEGATDENLKVAVDADAGAAWDFNLWEYTMLGKQDVIWIPDDGPIPLEKDDIVKVTYANTDDSTWGLTLMARSVN